MAKEVLLSEIYYGESEGALRGVKALFDESRRRGYVHISRRDCEEYLKTQPAYTLYKPARKNYTRNAIVANSPGEIYQVTIRAIRMYTLLI